MSNEMNRRKFLKLTGTVVLATSVAGALGGCSGGGGGGEGPDSSSSDSTSPVRPLLPAALRVLPARLVRLRAPLRR